MKITFPRSIKGFKSDNSEHVYLIIQQFSDGIWGFADCWDVRYAFKYYRDAVAMKKRIEKLHEQWGWKHGSAAIIKVTL